MCVYIIILSEVLNYGINLEIPILSSHFNRPIQCGLNFLLLEFEKFPAFSS